MLQTSAGSRKSPAASRWAVSALIGSPSQVARKTARRVPACPSAQHPQTGCQLSTLRLAALRHALCHAGLAADAVTALHRAGSSGLRSRDETRLAGVDHDQLVAV